METNIKTIIDLTEAGSDIIAMAAYQNEQIEDQHIIGIFEKDEPVCLIAGSFVHIEALYITLHEYLEALEKVPDLPVGEPLDKIRVMEALERLYNEDQQCSGNCDGCRYEITCVNLQTMLEDLFGYEE